MWKFLRVSLLNVKSMLSLAMERMGGMRKIIITLSNSYNCWPETKEFTVAQMHKPLSWSRSIEKKLISIIVEKASDKL